MSGSHFTVRESGKVQVVSTVPGFAWRCDECGWIGTGWTSQSGATREAADHVWTEHGLIPCDPDDLGGPHKWEKRPPMDAEQCARCEAWCGK